MATMTHKPSCGSSVDCMVCLRAKSIYVAAHGVQSSSARGDARRPCVSTLACPPALGSQAAIGMAPVRVSSWMACASTLARIAAADDADDRDEAGRVATNPIPIVEALKFK